MKKLIEATIVLTIICLFATKSYSQVSGIYEEYGPFTISSSTYTEMFTREKVKVYARVVQGSDANHSAIVYFRIENKNSKPAFVDANFTVNGIAVTGQYGKNKFGGVVPGDRINPNSYIEVKRTAENVRFVQTISCVLQAIYLSDKSSSGNAN